MFDKYVFNIQEEETMKKYWQKFLLMSIKDKAKVLGLIVVGMAVIGISMGKLYNWNPYAATAIPVVLWVYLVITRG